MNAPAPIDRPRKPARCPTCGHTPVATIMYGLPDFTDELRAELDAGRLTLGGCCITDDDPAWQCTACGQMIYQKFV